MHILPSHAVSLTYLLRCNTASPLSFRPSWWFGITLKRFTAANHTTLHSVTLPTNSRYEINLYWQRTNMATFDYFPSPHGFADFAVFSAGLPIEEGAHKTETTATLQSSVFNLGREELQQSNSETGARSRPVLEPVSPCRTT